VRVFLGGALLNLVELDGAMEEAKRAIALDSNYAKAYILAGRVCAAREQWDRAQSFFEEAEQRDKRDAESWYFSGRAYYDASRFEPAIAAFRQSLRLGGEQSRFYENLGLAYDGLAQFEQAEKSLRKAVELDGGTWRPYLAYGAFLFRQGRAAESLHVLRKAFDLAPNSEDVRFELARVLYHESKLEEASRLLEPLRPGNECRVHNLLARIYSAGAQDELARREVRAHTGCR